MFCYAKFDLNLVTRRIAGDIHDLTPLLAGQHQNISGPCSKFGPGAPGWLPFYGGVQMPLSRTPDIRIIMNGDTGKAHRESFDWHCLPIP